MRDRPANVDDVHEIASGMPHVKRIEGPKGNSVYQVGGKSFVFFRTPQPDAEDPETGERYADVIMIWVESESDKLALIQDPKSPFFTTERFDGHPSVLVRASALREIGQAGADGAHPGCVAVPGVEPSGSGVACRARTAKTVTPEARPNGWRRR